MTPQEKYERDLWWLMQQITLEELFAVDGQPIDFSLVVEKKGKSSPEIPSQDSQRKMLHKLQELKMLKLTAYNDPFGSNMFAEPTKFSLVLIKNTFYDVYETFHKKFENDIVEEEQINEPILTYEQPIVKDKALELIAEDLSNRNTHGTLNEIFYELQIPAEFQQEGSKKVRALSVLKNLARADKEKLFRMIEDAVHPLSFGTDIQRAKEVMDQYNSYLKYDGYQIIPSNGSSPKIMAINSDSNSGKLSGHLNTDEDKEKISLLRKAYQVLMGIVEVFCLDPANPDTQLNKFYLNTTKAVWDTIDELRLYGQFSTFKKPFTNLYAAEKEYNGKVSWDFIRPEMSAMFGQIETIYQDQNGSDILAEPDQQKQFNEIMLYLSELKEKVRFNREANKAEAPPLYFSDDYGLYLDKEKKKPNYPVTGKRAKLIQFLKNSKLSGQELCQLLDYSDQLLSKEINEINSTFRDKLSQKHDLIIHLDRGGYALNKEQYQFTLEKTSA